MLATLLAGPLASPPTWAGTRTLHDNDDDDVLTRDIGMARGYVDTWASARKCRPAHCDEGSPANSTGDRFDATYNLVVQR